MKIINLYTFCYFINHSQTQLYITKSYDLTLNSKALKTFLVDFDVLPTSLNNKKTDS